ncbi:MAG: efflux RND transporter periplasmic adaptor subunit [Acidobacteria bacterium]|nr:efflux RND transporter periplasmic adaptor subunit [Acidobacteriota bacterium]
MPMWVVWISCLLGGAACGPNRAAATTPPAATAVAVDAVPVRGEDRPVTIEATGSFAADESSEVAPETSGRVVATPVDVGAIVARGQVLVRVQGVEAGLRLDEAQAAVIRAEANVRLAESQNTLARTTAERYAALMSTGDVSKTLADQSATQAETSVQSVTTARASLAEARAQLAQAEKAVADIAVTAPFAGAISARHVALGEYVQPSTPVVTLVKVDPLRLLLTVPAVQAAQVERGQRVTTTVDAYPGRTFTGVVSAVNPVIVTESRSFVTEVRVPNPGGVLKPGMFAVATIDQGRTSRVLTVPRAAVVEDVNTNSWRVFVIDQDSRARLRVVQLAPRQSGDRVQLLGGVEEGERVATTQLADLYDSAPVTIDDDGDDD